MGNNLNRTVKQRTLKKMAKDIKKQAKGSVEFPLRLYQRLAKSNSESNIAFSPMLVTGLLAMVAEGARGNTAEELKRVLQFTELTKDQQFHHIDFLDNVMKLLNCRISGESHSVVSYNGMYVQKSYVISDQYTRLLSHYYLTEFNLMDFMKELEKAQSTINSNASWATNIELMQAIPRGAISQSSQFILLNVMFVDSYWHIEFDCESDINFKKNNKDDIKIDMLRSIGKYHLVKNSDLKCKLIQIDFAIERLALYVLLPDATDGLECMERRLTPEVLNSLMASVTESPKRMVHLEIPVFRLEIRTNMKDVLLSLGIKDLFSPDDADLAGISPMMGLHVSEMLHAVTVHIDSNTNPTSAPSICARSRPKHIEIQETFRADHPFMFYVYDKEAKIMLLMGHVTDPSKYTECTCVSDGAM